MLRRVICVKDFLVSFIDSYFTLSLSCACILDNVNSFKTGVFCLNILKSGSYFNDTGFV